jgi:hypothetical protein
MNRNADWDKFFALLKDVDVPEDFLSTENRNQGICTRDPFDGWEEPTENSGDEIKIESGSAPRASARPILKHTACVHETQYARR